MNEISLFGCSLDPDEREESIRRKARYISRGDKANLYSSPYDVISKLVDLLGRDFRKRGAVAVESWLTPFPTKSDLMFMTVPNFVSFIDEGGCYEYAEKVYEFTKRQVLPDIPFFIGVDHSLTGGVLKALSEKYESEELGVIFLDAHFDGISLPMRCEMISYDNEKESSQIRSKHDPYLSFRKDSYNTESFIRFLVKEEIVLPNNIVCVGVSNYPSKEAFDSKDFRVKRYIEEFTELEKKGLRIIKKEDIRRDPSILHRTLQQCSCNHAYVSIDMDIGANASCEGVRFSDGFIGMTPKEILKIVEDVGRFILGSASLVGLDLMEIDMHTANELTYTLGLEIIDKLLPRLTERATS